MTTNSGTLRVGSRGSALALRQTELAMHALGIRGAIVTVATKGDRVTDREYSEIGPKGIFAAELQRALLSDEIDIAVHSLKDLPATEPEGLEVAAVLERDEVRDAVVGRALGDLEAGATVGTSSARRKAQLLALRSDINVVHFRGNVDTRLRKVSAGEVDAAVLAGAGLVRLGHTDAVAEWLDPSTFLPAPGQGAIAAETRSGRFPWLREGEHTATRVCVDTERAFMREMEGGCQVPLGAWARVEEGTILCDGFVGLPDGSRIVRGSARGTEPGPVGAALARNLEDAGAHELLERLRPS